MWGQNNRNCPCMYCDTRDIGCHSGCADYEGWKIQDAQRMADYRREREINSALIDLQSHRVQELTRKKHVVFRH